MSSANAASAGTTETAGAVQGGSGKEEGPPAASTTAAAVTTVTLDKGSIACFVRVCPQHCPSSMLPPFAPALCLPLHLCL